MNNNKYINDLIHHLLNNENFGLTPHSPNPNKDIKFIFDFFINLNTSIILNELIQHSNHKGFKNALALIFHYKGEIQFFSDTLPFNDFKILKPFLNSKSIYQFNSVLYMNYANEILNGNSLSIDSEVLNIILNNNLDLYIDISLKLGLDNIKIVFDKNKDKVFDWLNKHKSTYTELIKLNQPQYIFSNMNGKLDVNDDSLKYFFEICPFDIGLYKELKKTIPIKTIWKHTKHKLSVEFLFELVETIDELIFVLTLPNIPISSMENILDKLKTKFPLLYENFNSLLVMKKEFP